MRVRKTLTETLILSKLNFCNSDYSHNPQYLMKRLRRVQTCTAAYVKGRCTKIQNVIELSWLPNEENIYYSLVKYAFHALNNHERPTYFPLVKVKRKIVLRSNQSGPQLRTGDKSSFEEQALMAFNNLQTAGLISSNQFF